jgi:hypothetical protein
MPLTSATLPSSDVDYTMMSVEIANAAAVAAIPRCNLLRILNLWLADFPVRQRRRDRGRDESNAPPQAGVCPTRAKIMPNSGKPEFGCGA